MHSDDIVAVVNLLFVFSVGRELIGGHGVDEVRVALNVLADVPLCCTGGDRVG